jgi:hypothetical protein
MLMNFLGPFIIFVTPILQVADNRC